MTPDERRRSPGGRGGRSGRPQGNRRTTRGAGRAGGQPRGGRRGDSDPATRQSKASGRGGRSRGGGGKGPLDPREELARYAGKQAEREYGRLREAADAFESDRYRDARRILTVLRDRYPQATSVIELHGLTLYRLERWKEAEAELERFVTMTGSTEQHPVLMDTKRARGRHEQVEELWDELRSASPSGELVTEGRIVMAGSLADRDRLADAIRVLEKGPVEPKRVKDHHLRLWYALADLEERAGNLPRARTLFEQIRRREPTFADVPERLANLA